MSRLHCLLAALAAAGFAHGAGKALSHAVDSRLEPGKVLEVCDRVEAGETRRYYWKADAPVDFNIHYHRGDEVFYPVRREAMRGDGGAFRAPSGEDYCWMWTARNAPARVQGGVE